MASFVTSADEFATLLETRRRLIRDDVALPGNVFKIQYQFFRVTEWPFVLTAGFFRLIQELSGYLGLSQIVIMMIDPDPFEHYRYFSRYGAIVFGCHDDSDEIVTLCWEPPDSVIDGVEKLAIFPVSKETTPWCVYRDRYDCEAGIIGFKNMDAAERFIEMDRDQMTVEPRRAIETFIPQPFWPHDLPPGFKEAFLANYSEAT